MIPELRESQSGGASLLLLLSHRAGLSPHLALYLPAAQRQRVDPNAALRAAAEARRQECRGLQPAEGFAPLYSDLGYLLVGEAIRRAVGASLADVVEHEVCNPLDLAVASAATYARRVHDFKQRAAPTEVVAFRGGEVTGVAHDENAWALVGDGIAGHAGLFGTAEGVARFGVAVLDALAGRRRDWLDAEQIAPLVRERPGGTLRAGFDGRAAEGSSAGSAFGPRSFGHLGFTGTSLGCDPDAARVAVILTNRVSPTRENQRIRTARPLLNDALFHAATASDSD
jgi:CubicO group peptidase (beta-lactamase class C family)